MDTLTWRWQSHVTKTIFKLLLFNLSGLKMKYPSFVVCLVVTSIVLLQGCGRSSESDSTFPEDFRATILEMKEKEQDIRRRIVADQTLWDSLAPEMVRLDSIHTVYLKEVVAKYGWPDTLLAGKDGVQAAFLIVQHSPDYAFQEDVLPMLKKSYEDGMIRGGSLALLTDRILVHQGKPQLYGSQAYKNDGDDVWRFRPIEDSLNLDKRREEMGMIPYADYVKLLSQNYKTAK